MRVRCHPVELLTTFKKYTKDDIHNFAPLLHNQIKQLRISLSTKEREKKRKGESKSFVVTSLSLFEAF